MTNKLYKPTVLHEDQKTWLEQVSITVEGQEIVGMACHVGITFIHVMMLKPYPWFYASETFSPPHFARGVHPYGPDGLSSESGTERAKELLKEMYLKHREYGEQLAKEYSANDEQKIDEDASE